MLLRHFLTHGSRFLFCRPRPEVVTVQRSTCCIAFPTDGSRVVPVGTNILRTAHVLRHHNPPTSWSTIIVTHHRGYNSSSTSLNNGRSPPAIGVIDVKQVITGMAKQNAGNYFARMKTTHHEVSTNCRNYRVPGRWERLTPVMAGTRSIVELMLAHPSRNAARVRRQAARTRRLASSESFSIPSYSNVNIGIIIAITTHAMKIHRRRGWARLRI